MRREGRSGGLKPLKYTEPVVDAVFLDHRGGGSFQEGRKGVGKKGIAGVLGINRGEEDTAA